MDIVWVFILGAIFGSVANALIDRVPRSESWIKGRSKCDHCGHTLGLIDLVPLFSFVLIGGKCRYCHKKIAIRNFIVELLMAVLFALAYVNNLNVFNYPIIWLTIIIAVIDWETQLVSELMVLAWGLLVPLTNPGMFTSYSYLIGAAVALFIIGGLWAATKGRGMGFGDVEISIVLGLTLGWPNVLVGLWMAFVIGAFVGLVKMFFRKSNLKSTIAFGPFLIIGVWIARIWGDMILKTLFF